MNGSEDDLDDNKYYVGLSIFHPSIDPSEITRALSLDPEFSWKKGERRRLPNGSMVDGYREETHWRYSSIMYRDRFFFDRMRVVVEYLCNYSSFVSRLIDDGGRVILSAEIEGRRNIGDVMENNLMSMLVGMRVQLGIEVFPIMNEY